MTTAAPERNGLAHALSLHRAGRHDEAEAQYRATIAAEPANAEAHHLLALLLKETGRSDEAARAMAEAIALAPDEPLYRFTSGTIAMQRDDAAAAVAAFESALERKAGFPEAATNLGLALAKTGRADAAEAAHRRALAINPQYPLAHYNLGQLLHRQGRIGEAVECYRAALAAAPDYRPAQLNLAYALRQRGENGGAEAAYRRAIALAPAAADAWLGLGMVQKDRGDLAAAIDSFGEALRRNPVLPEAHLNLALALLSLGRWEEAWPHYEQRWHAVPLVHHRRRFEQPAWDGSAPGARTLLVHAEQGLGDTIQFAHLLREIGADPARLVFELPPVLMPLLQPFARYARLVPKCTALPPFDMHCPLMDLPRHLGLTPARIAPMTGLLAADPQRAEAWRKRLAPLRNGRRLVALAWQGGEENPENRVRSLDPALLAPLYARDDLVFVSLQKNAAVPHPSVVAPATLAPDGAFDPKGAAFLDSAAIMQAADIVATVDTALAHLAGALGRPGCVLLPHVCDWRWLTGRTDTPWYPSLRLLRQPVPGDWASVVHRLDAQLRAPKDRA